MVKPLRIAEDLVPIAQFKGKAGQLLRQIRQSRQHVVITHHGKAAGVVMSPEEFDRMRERQKLLEEIAAGIADLEAGRTVTTRQLRKELGRARAQRRR